MLPQFEAASGVVLFLVSLVFTRGIEAVKMDMDDPSSTLIGACGCLRMASPCPSPVVPSPLHTCTHAPQASSGTARRRC